jgi:hypothetical protein
MFTRALHSSLSWASSIQSTPSHPISLRSILILFTHLRLGLPSGLFPSPYNLCSTLDKKFWMKIYCNRFAQNIARRRHGRRIPNTRAMEQYGGSVFCVHTQTVPMQHARCLCMHGDIMQQWVVVTWCIFCRSVPGLLPCNTYAACTCTLTLHNNSV